MAEDGLPHRTIQAPEQVAEGIVPDADVRQAPPLSPAAGRGR